MDYPVSRFQIRQIAPPIFHLITRANTAANTVAGTERIIQELVGVKQLIDPDARAQEAGAAAAKA